jgi:hypothetical protein
MSCVFLVSCVSRKKNVPLAAKELYDSAWFQKARMYVESTGSPWFILSAKYGVVDPEAVIEPYDETLNTMSVHQRREWSKKVLSELRKHLQSTDKVIIFAGIKYREFLLRELRSLCSSVEVPMEGLRIGEQLSWLGKH